MENVTDAAHYTLQFINQTQRSVFLTGNAGTGKTTLLKEIIATTHKNTVVVAPTGIAALNAGGVTIHSMFQLPFGGFIPEFSVASQFTETLKLESKATLQRHFRMSGQKKAVLRNMELLIIDEVSMLRADLLDAIDFMLQSVRKTKMPFGGVQVLFIGDLLQLPPVVKDEEWRILRNYYQGKFFFNAHVIQNNPPLYIELSKIYRQTDASFIAILNNLRNNKITPEDVLFLNNYVHPQFDLSKNKGYITLTTHNNKADSINNQSISSLKGELITYQAEITGDFPDKIYPLDITLSLKVGAQVMFVKNDLSFDKNYFNGKMGQITSLSSQEILVHFPDENKTIEVEKYEWQNIRYSLDAATMEVKEEVIGTFVHYPIKLAWAITVHKSQGLTFDKAALDVSQVFLPGQAYVAFSRLRSLKGLVLLSPLQMNGISNDADVMHYAQNKASTDLLQDSLEIETRNFFLNYLCTTFNWTNLVQEWRNHKFSYPAATEASPKAKHGVWAKKQLELMEKILDPSQKFISQLQQLFSKPITDLNHIQDRYSAAYAYFFPTLDAVIFELLWKIEEVLRTKKAKTYFDELQLLLELQTKAILQLMKAKVLLETLVSGQPISKETLASPEISSYIPRKTAAIHQQFVQENSSLVSEDIEIKRYTAKTKTPKEPKKATTEETFLLWQAKNSIADIAKLRTLTVGTIEGHIAKLIQAQKIQITEVLPADKLTQLAELFANYTNESLVPLKEQVGEAFSYNELRMYKASL